jgi:hypothetical protein
VLEKEAFQKQMLEKLIWISAFMLVGARHPGATVGVVEKDYQPEVTFCLVNSLHRSMFLINIVHIAPTVKVFLA